jgi:hypothetical protein
MTTISIRRFKRTPNVRELIMALREVAHHDALVKIDGAAQNDIAAVELTMHGSVNFVYLCIGALPFKEPE